MFKRNDRIEQLEWELEKAYYVFSKTHLYEEFIRIRDLIKEIYELKNARVVVDAVN